MFLEVCVSVSVCMSVSEDLCVGASLYVCTYVSL